MKFTTFAAALACAFVTTTAQAALIQAEYTGKMARVFDNLHVLGAGPIVGKDYVLRFRFDTDLGFDDTLTATDQWRVGGSSRGAEPFILSTVFQVNGTTHHFGSEWFSGAYYRQGGSISHAVNGDPDGQPYIFAGFLNDPLLPFSRITQLGSYAGTGNGALHIYQDEFNSTTASFTVETLKLTAVPEPATWALTILGFGAAGATLRRRRAAAI